MQEVKEGISENPNSKKSENSKPEFVKWFSELNKDSGKIAGGKGANLAEIYNLRIPVPPGFVVTAQAYDYFIEKAGLKDKIKELLSKIDYEDTSELNEITKQIRNLIENAKFPKEMEEEIIESYNNLDIKEDDFKQTDSVVDILKTSREPLFVAVRSSATAEDLADASFAGQQDSFVNVKGNTELIHSIKKCFASLYTARATYYRQKKKFKHEDVSLAVIVQKMVDSIKSGVVFSKNPAQKDDNIVIEAVWGLGEGIVSGRITPDKYLVSPELKIIDTKLANKKIAITRDAGGKKVTVKLNEEKSKQQVLKEYEIRKLSEIAIKLEKHYQKPQDIEFAIENEDIMIVQTRPITTIALRVEVGEEIKGEAILSGLAASPGIGVGKVKIVKNLADLSKVNKGDILVTSMTNPDMVVTMQRSAAIVTDEGGLTAHAAIVSREMGIPCIVGTQEATIKLKEGEIITVDGTHGKVYKGKVAEVKQKEVLPVTAQTKTEIKVIVDLPSFAERASKSGLKKVGLTRIEGIIAESGKHPEYFLKQKKISDYEEVIFKGISGIAKYFEELWIRTSDIRSDEFQNLEGAPKEKEANPMLGMHGIRYGLKNPDILKAELKALKRVSEEGKIIGLLLPQIISVEEVKKVKEFLKEIEFSKAKVGVMVETPAAVQIINDLCAEGIEFISFGTNDLTQYILAVDRGNEQVQYIYNELNSAILYQLEFVIRVCKRNKVQTSICGQAGSKKEMVKFLVEKGIDSISVNADLAKEITEYVAEIEKGMTKGTDLEPRQYKTKKEEENNQENFVKPQNIDEKVVAEEEKIIKNNKEVEEVAQKSHPSQETKTQETTIEKKEESIKVADKQIQKNFNKKIEPEERLPEIPGVQNLPKEKIQEDIQAIEKEKEEYLKKNSEKTEDNSIQNTEEKEEFDEEPEFKDEKEINKKEEDEILDIF